MALGIHFPVKGLARSYARMTRLQTQKNILRFVLDELEWEDDHEKMQERLLWALFIFQGLIPVKRETASDMLLAELIVRLSRYFGVETEDTRRAEKLLDVMVRRFSSIPPPAPSGVRRSEPPILGVLRCSSG